MAKFITEVLVRNDMGEPVWRPVRPSGGEPYTYDTYGEAEQFRCQQLEYDALQANTMGRTPNYADDHRRVSRLHEHSE